MSECEDSKSSSGSNYSLNTSNLLMVVRSRWKTQPPSEDSLSCHQPNALGNNKWITPAAEICRESYKPNKSLIEAVNLPANQLQYLCNSSLFVTKITTLGIGKNKPSLIA